MTENIKDKDIQNQYVGFCRSHNWEGMRRDSRLEAELDLRGHIELFPDESHTGADIREEKSIGTKAYQTHRESSRFFVNILKETDAYFELILCTGENLQIPKSVITNFKSVGICTSDSQTYSSALIEFNKNSPEGLAIHQLANIISNIHNQKISQINLDELITPVVQGVACRRNFSTFIPDKDIKGCRARQGDGIVLIDAIFISKREILIVHEALGGTVCDSGYGGKAQIDIW